MKKPPFEHTIPRAEAFVQVSRAVPPPPVGADVEGRSRCPDGAGLTILITDRCDRTCPECLYRDLVREPGPDMTPAELEEMAPHLQGFRAVFIGGGEPTLHPQLDVLARIVREHLAPPYLYLSTDGVRIGDWHDVARSMTFVNLTQHRGGWTLAYRELHALGAGVVLNSARHWPWPPAPRPAEACYRAGVRVLRGRRLYPCPGGPGIPGAASVEVGPGCLDAVVGVPRPCDACPFGVTRAQ